MDAFTRGYLEAALWAELDEAGKPWDARFGVQDFAPKALEKAEQNCRAFLSDENARDLFGVTSYRAGFLFWLSRNGHGSGFFDEDALPEGARERLQKAARAFGECNVYEGDDGLLYLS